MCDQFRSDIEIFKIILKICYKFIIHVVKLSNYHFNVCVYGIMSILSIDQKKYHSTDVEFKIEIHLSNLEARMSHNDLFLLSTRI